MKKIISVFLLLFGFSISKAQVIEEWVKRYNGPGNNVDGAYSIAVDNSGNVYVTGISAGSGTHYDYCTIKYNSSGVQQWAPRYNGPGNGDDYAHSIAVDNSGNVYVTGISYGSGTSYDYCTIKYNSSGVQQWAPRYNGPGNSYDYAYSIAADNSGNIYVTGYSIGSGTYSDYCTIKYNSSGLISFLQRYNGPGNSYDYANSIAVDNSGNGYVTGASVGIGTNDDYCTIKYNSSGVQEWAQRYNGPGNGNDGANSIAVDDSGNVYVTGASVGIGTNDDYCTIKYNSSGVQEWVQRYNAPGNSYDYAYSIAGNNSGNVYVTGMSIGIGTNYDYCTVKYNSSGVQGWVQRYNGPGNGIDEARSITLDNSGNVYVTGWSTGSGTEYDYCTIKYHDITGIRPISNEVPKSYELFQNYPNPFNPVTKIEFAIPLTPQSPLEGGQRWVTVRLLIYDILGREVATLVNEQLKPGTYEVEWSATGGARDFRSGVYFYKLSAGDFTDTKKMVLAK